MTYHVIVIALAGTFADDNGKLGERMDYLVAHAEFDSFTLAAQYASAKADAIERVGWFDGTVYVMESNGYEHTSWHSY